MGFIQHLKSLPISTKRLLGVGVIFALAVALPLFIWAVVTQRFELREMAQEEPSPSPTATSSAPPPTVCASVPMSIEITPEEQSGGLGITKRYTIKVTNNDDESCGQTHSVYLTADPPTFEGNIYTHWTTNFTTESFDVGAHEIFTTYLDVKSATSDYAIGKYAITVRLTSINIPQNSTSQTLFYNLIGETPSPSPSPTSTPTATPTTPAIGGPQETPTPTPVIGEPNYCGGTCGSNYNCQGGYFCYQGFCRNPLCKEDSDCDCVTPVPAATLKPKPTKTPVPTMEVIILSPMASSSPKASPTIKPSPTVVATSIPEKTDTNLNFLLYLAGGSFSLAVVLLIAKALAKK